MARLDELIAMYQGTPEFEFDKLTIEIGEAICARMDELGMNRTELAKRMGVSQARVTQVLSGADNLTLKTLVGVASALGSTWTVELNSAKQSATSTHTSNPGAEIADLPKSDQRSALAS